MPDLQPVYDELRRRASAHEDAFVVSHSLTDAYDNANAAAGGRKADELTDLTPLGRELYSECGRLAR